MHCSTSWSQSKRTSRGVSDRKPTSSFTKRWNFRRNYWWNRSQAYRRSRHFDFSPNSWRSSKHHWHGWRHVEHGRRRVGYGCLCFFDIESSRYWWDDLESGTGTRLARLSYVVRHVAWISCLSKYRHWILVHRVPQQISTWRTRDWPSIEVRDVCRRQVPHRAEWRQQSQKVSVTLPPDFRNGQTYLFVNCPL